jgi:large subunit ribosomal protein L29
MRPAEVRELSSDELRGREKELDDQLFRMRIQKSMGQLEAPAKMVTLRRDLARIKTILRERDTQRSGKETQRSEKETLR